MSIREAQVDVDGQRKMVILVLKNCILLMEPLTSNFIGSRVYWLELETGGPLRSDVCCADF